MYGTIFRIRPKAGQEQAVVDNFNDWRQERKPKVKGAIGGLLMKPDAGSGELVGVAVFQDKATYEANAGDPEQDWWFRTFREMLEADPEWEDGEYVAGNIG